MKHYIAAIEPAQVRGSTCWIRFPQFPNAEARTEDDFAFAVSFASKVLSSHAETQPMPDPLPLDDVAKMVAADGNHSSDVVLVAIPLFIDSDRTVKITITMPADVKEAVDYTAKQRGQSRSGFMVTAAKAAMEGKG